MNEVKHNHVQISKFLMKPFAHNTSEGKKVYYLDFKDYGIYEEKISKLGTKDEYYYPSTEDFLKEIEDKAGDIFAKWKKALLKNLEIRSSEQDDYFIKRFVSYNFLRSSGLKRKTISSSVYLQFFKEKDQTELVIATSEHVMAYFSNFFSNILKNSSSVDFVIPHNCLYTLPCFEQPYTKDFFWCMPVSPRCCVVLIPNNQKEIYIDENKIYSLDVIKDNEVMYMNHRALLAENTHSKNFIVGNNLNELERLSTILKIINK